MEGHPTTSAATARSELTITDLDDDSLGMIFNKLPYVYRTRIESVCKRWLGVSAANWYSYTKRLKIGEDTGPFPLQPGNTAERNATLLAEILRRREPYLEEISFWGVYGIKFSMGTIKRIVERCPKLKRLHAGNLHLNGDDWTACSNLESLGFSFSARASTGELGQLFRRNKRLRRLQIVCNAWCKSRDFDYLDAGQLECLQMTLCKNFELTAGIADKLADSLVELEYSPHPSDTWKVQHLCKLKSLRSLKLAMDSGWIEAKFVADVAKCCRKLERLTLSFFEDHICNQNVIAPLFRLRYLSRLVITVGENKMPREELDKLFQNAPNLKLFVVCTCHVCIFEKGEHFNPNRKTCVVYKS